MISLLLLAVPAFGEGVELPGLPIGAHSKPPMICPRSRSPLHAYAKVQTQFKNSCQEVQDEIHARLKGEMTNMGKPWMDPHNGGTYYDLGMGQYTDDGRKGSGETWVQIQTMRRSPNRNPVGTYFHDKQYFTFVPITKVDKRRSKKKGGDDSGGEGCMVYACSASQGPSATDGGTNFCDMHDLYCNSSDNCEWVKYDLDYNEMKKSANIGSRTNKWICTGRPPRALYEEAEGEEEFVFPEYLRDAEFWVDTILAQEGEGLEAPIKQSY